MIKLKHLLISSALILASGLAAFSLSQSGTVGAQSVLREEEAISQSEKVNGSFFGAGSTIHITSPVDGDIYAAGQNVSISGDIKGDVLVAAQSVTISGTIEGSVRVAAQSLTVTGEVKGSLSALAQNFLLDKPAIIQRDLSLVSQLAIIDGKVNRDLHGAIDTLNISGNIGRDVKYTSAKDANLSNSSVVAGEITRTAPQEGSNNHKRSTDPVVGWLSTALYAIFAIVLATLLFTLVAPKWLRVATDRALPRPWMVMLIGLLTAAVTPLVILLLIISIIGIPLAIALIFAAIALTLLSTVFTSAYIGRLVFRDRQNPVIQNVTGGIIYVALLSLPLVSIAVWIIGSLIGLGSIISTAIDNLTDKPTTTKSASTVETEAKAKKAKTQSQTKPKPKA